MKVHYKFNVQITIPQGNLGAVLDVIKVLFGTELADYGGGIIRTIQDPNLANTCILELHINTQKSVNKFREAIRKRCSNDIADSITVLGPLTDLW